MTNGEEFNRYFWKHYQFWMLVFSAVSICAIAYFSYLSYTTQSILRSIEETRQREKFSNDLEIVFLSNAFAGCSPAKANYELRLINKSSHNFEDLEATVALCYENPESREVIRCDVFSFPRIELFPTNLPVSLVENPQLTKTFRFNITEAKKTIPDLYTPKSFEFLFRWRVEIGDNKYLGIEKVRNFSIRR